MERQGGEHKGAGFSEKRVGCVRIEIGTGQDPRTDGLLYRMHTRVYGAVVTR